MIGGSDFHGIYKQNRIGSGNVSFAYILKTFYEVKAVVTGEGISSIDDLDIYEKIGLMIKPNYNTMDFTNDFFSIFLDSGKYYSKIFRNDKFTSENLLDFVKSQLNFSKIPVLIDINQEGGRLETVKLNSRSLLIPDRYYLVDKELVFSEMQLVDEMLFKLGISWNFWPVVEDPKYRNITISQRNFCDDSVQNIRQYLSVLREGRVLKTLKHYPVCNLENNIDTHFQNSKLQEIDIVTENFKIGCELGYEVIMLTNLLTSEGKLFASEKKNLDNLRTKLKFDGVLISDNISMKSLGGFELQSIVKNLLIAGVDIILYGSDFTNENRTEHGITLNSYVSRFYEKRDSVYNAILDLYDSGKITEEEIDSRVTKIFKLFFNYGLKKLENIASHSDEIKSISHRLDCCAKKINYEVIDKTLSTQKIFYPDLIFSYNPNFITSADSSWKTRIDLPETLDIEISQLNSQNYIRELEGLDSSRKVLFIGYSIEFSDIQQEILDYIIRNKNSVIIVDTGDKKYVEKKMKQQLSNQTYCLVSNRTNSSVQDLVDLLKRRAK